MGLIVDAMHKGGPFMWPILLIAIVGLPVPFVLAGLAGTGKRVPAVVWWVLPMFALLLGGLGTGQGLMMTLEAVSYASNETKSPLAHAGYSTSLFTLIGGSIVAANQLLLSAFLGGASYLVAGGGESARSSRKVPLLIGAVALVSGVALVGLSMSEQASALTKMTAVYALIGGLSIAVASVRRGGHDASDRALADGRFTVAACALGAVVAAALSAWITGEILIHEAMAHASNETRALLVSVGSRMRASGTAVGAGGIIVTALLGAISVLPVVGKMRNAWSLVNVGLSVLGALVVGGVLLGVHATTQPVLQQMTETQLVGLRDAVPDLPETTPLKEGVNLSVYERPMVQNNGGWMYYNGAAVTLPRPPEEGVVIAVSGATSARAIAEEPWFDEYGKLSIVTAGPVVEENRENPWLAKESLHYVRVDWEGVESQLNELDMQERLYVSEVDGRFLISRFGGDEATVASMAEATALLESVLVGNEHLIYVVFVPGDRWSISDLTALCAATNLPISHGGTTQHRRCVLTTRMLEE